MTNRIIVFFYRAGNSLQNRLAPIPACSLLASQSCLLIFTLIGDLAGLLEIRMDDLDGYLYM